MEVPRRKHPDIDGGWGYVVAVTCLFVAFIIDGCKNSFGVLMPTLLEKLQSSVPLTSFAGGTLDASWLATGPVSAKLIERYGCRPVAFVGGLIASTSVVLCTFSTRIEMFIVFYGVLAGFGIGLLYLPSITIINTYFERKRGLVLGIITSGSGVGLLVMSLLIEYLINQYGWRGAYLIIGGIYLHLCFCACLMRPLDPGPYLGVETSKDEEKETQCLLSTDDKGEEKNFDVCIGENPKLADADPTVTEIGPRWDVEITEITKDTKSSDDNNFKGAASEKDKTTVHSERSDQSLLSKSSKCAEIKSGSMLNRSNSYSDQVLNAKAYTMEGEILEKILYPEKSKSQNNKRHINNSIYVHSSHPRLSGVTENLLPVVGRRRSRTHDPLTDGGYLDDVHCHSGHIREKLGASSLSRMFVNIPSECISLSTTSLHVRSRSQTNELESGLIPGTGSSKDICASHKETEDFEMTSSSSISLTASYSALSLLKDPCLALFCISAFLIQLANSIAPMFAPSYARSLGLDSTQAAKVVSILGVSNTIGRLLTGVLSYWGISNLFIYSAGTSIAGLLCFAIPLCTSYASLIAFAAGQGFFIGVFPPLQSVILVELLGLERLPSSFGLMCFCKSIASMAGPSIGGGLYQMFQDYAVPFLFAGGIISLANILHCILAVCRRWQLSKSQPQPDSTSHSS